MSANQNDIVPEMSVPEGAEVGSILTMVDDKEILFFGYGILEKYDVPPYDPHRMKNNAFYMHAHTNKLMNPKIVLDDDKGIVWGCECWWGPKEQIQKSIEVAKQAGKIVTMITPDEAMEKFSPVEKDGEMAMSKKPELSAVDRRRELIIQFNEKAKHCGKDLPYFGVEAGRIGTLCSRCGKRFEFYLKDGDHVLEESPDGEKS